MGMTITEKILAAHSGLNKVEPGQLINARVDIALGNDITAPIAIKEFKKAGAAKVFDRDKVVLVPDHFAPNKDIQSAEQCKMLREFAREQDLTHYYETGEMGVEHALLPEQGVVLPGDLVIGADSHTCLYRAMEICGETIEDMGMAGRMTIANMVIEAGAKNGIIAPDKITEEYVKSRAKRGYKFFQSDPDAKYVDVREYDCANIEPQVAFPHLPENTKGLSEAVSLNVSIDQAVIGSCTNGRLEDLRVAANVLKGQKVHKYVRLLVIPATQWIYRQAMKEGLFDIFLDAGAAISTPTCGPCLGGHMGILAKGERAIATTNRNFVGRMGHPESEVYLSNPAVAAASAVLGRIASPDELKAA
ncbi:MAG: 3-isopropylmalate dehydratase large subunit [Deltaproteobacteria bacterium]|nr:3-isopropylmalate dehydratase large subunit [Deltaproteobacteria bacterium]